MRPHFIKTSIALFLCASFAASASSAADWNGSYSAEGQCFCVGAVAAGVENSIVPTPVGGQTVAQVCQRIGAGPGLTLEGELYNYPVYSDSQCGHGPFETGSNAIQANCAGSLDGKGLESSSCQPIGPRWDINQANTKKKTQKVKASVEKQPEVKASAEQKALVKAVVNKQANASNKSKPTTSLLNKPVVTSISVKRAGEDGGKTRTLKATVISSASTAGRALPKREAMEPFTGKIITIGGKRYMQAREDLPAKGGQPGSRIILDGSVYLLDDGTINPTDLRRGTPAKVKKPKKTSKKSSKANKQRLASVSQNVSVNSINSQEKTLRADRNSVPRALPNSINSNTPAISPETKRVTDLTDFRKADVLPGVATTVVTPDTTELLETPLAGSSVRNEAPNSAQITTVTEELNNTKSNAATAQVGLLSALILPNSLDRESGRFSYVEAMPVSFDVGGTGFLVKGSTESHSKFHYVGRIGVTSSYQEVMLGGGYYLTPRSADRLTMVVQAGVEYGSFRLDDDQNADITVNYNDTGLYFGAATRLVLNHRFELRGGLGYSTFFQGDLLMFGGAYWHMTPKIDLVSQFELGDNDLIGLGIRFYY